MAENKPLAQRRRGTYLPKICRSVDPAGGDAWPACLLLGCGHPCGELTLLADAFFIMMLRKI